MGNKKEIFKTNPAIEEKRKYNELISALTPILTKIKSASSLNKDNFASNTRDFNNSLWAVSHLISQDSLAYERARQNLFPDLTQDYIKKLQQGTANYIHLPEVNEVSDIINELNNIKQEDVDKIMNLNWSSPASLFKINPKILKQFYNFKKTMDSWVRKNTYKQGGILKRVEKAQNGTSIKGKYLGKDYRDYYAYFKSYDNFINSQSYKNIIDPKQKILAKNMARYYYNTNPELNDFWELAYHTIPEYNKKMAQYKYNDKYIIDMGEPSYRLKSLDVNGKPTNKHTLKMHQNVLDYIYNEAVRGGVDPKTAISIATQESNLGVARQKDSKINAFDLFSYWNGIGDSIYTNAQIVDTYNDLYKKITSDQQLSPKDLQNIQLLKERYNKMNSSIHEYNGDNVVADAVKYFNTGKYNPGDPNYIDTVNSRFDELMNDDRFANWWNSKQRFKFGGILKRK